MLERKDILYETVPQGYIIDSMLYFLQLVHKLKNGTNLKELDGAYPSGEEALISTQICETIHLSAEKKEIVEIS
jgi:hypothetical protein